MLYVIFAGYNLTPGSYSMSIDTMSSNFIEGTHFPEYYGIGFGRLISVDTILLVHSKFSDKIDTIFNRNFCIYAKKKEGDKLTKIELRKDEIASGKLKYILIGEGEDILRYQLFEEMIHF
jgi:hypothetical protein